MCGICGIKRLANTPIDPDIVELLIVNNENRGIEAAGVALQQANGDIHVYKQDLHPYQFVGSREYKDFIQKYLKPTTVAAIGHTRKVTKGSPRVNKNNHPMFAGKTAVVHNGVIINDDKMFADLHLERQAETDSDIFRAILDKEGFTRKAANLLNRLNGNGAFAAFHPDYPGQMLIGRSGNPIEFMATPDYLMFSSETGPLYKAVRPYKEVWGIFMREMTPTEYYMIPMHDDSVWLLRNTVNGADISESLVEWHQELHIAPDHWQPHKYDCHAQYYGNRVKFYEDKPAEIVMCPKCDNYIELSKPAKLSELKNWKCKGCGTRLG